MNVKLMLGEEAFNRACGELLPALKDIRQIKDSAEHRALLNRMVYTCQQSIGCALDARNNPNGARKLNGQLFERLIRALVLECGVQCSAEVQKVAIPNSEECFSFQHDVVLKDALGEWQAIGQIKTSTKDRLDKVFMDRMIYEKLNDACYPYFLVVLNDVQRAKGRQNDYTISNTFLPGHYMFYSLAFSPFSGCYYVDRGMPSRKSKGKDQRKIKTLDFLLVGDMWSFIEK